MLHLTMIRSMKMDVALSFLLILLPAYLHASWLSDITGIDINISRGAINFGPPRPHRIPQMLENLPKDASQFFLNPAGSTLAFAIRQAKEQAKDGCRPVPHQVVRDLSPFFPLKSFQESVGMTVDRDFL